MGLTKWSREVMALLLCIFVLLILKEVEAYRVEKSGKILHFESGRILVENGNSSESVLTRRTERVDPLDDLKRYKGGFNITNKHYWGSVIFTGKFGYFIGAAWLVGGLIYAAILIISSLCFSKHGRYERNRPNSFNKGYNWPILLAISLTFLAIIASGVALGASSMFHSRAKTIKNIVVNATNNASDTIYTVTEAVENLQNATEFSQNVQGSSKIASTSKKLNDDTRRIERKANRIMRWVSKGLNILNAVTVVTISLNLVAILALLGVLRLRRIFRTLIILCWLLIILLWAYFGLYYFFGKLYYFFGKFAGDVCIALDEYKQNPEQSTLSSILPCNDRGSAAKVLHDVSGRVYDLIQKVNSNITSLKSSFSKLEYICNPFSGPPEYTYQPQNCSSDTITVGQVPQVSPNEPKESLPSLYKILLENKLRVPLQFFLKLIKNFACSANNSGGCRPGEFIPADVYGALQNYTKSMQDILDAYPVMKSLINCQLVKNAFSNILFNHCKPLKKYVHMSWASLAALSTIMVILIFIWESKACRDHKFRSSDGSVKPSLSPMESVEVDAPEMVHNDREHMLEMKE